jgi:hypothetical protein
VSAADPRARGDVLVLGVYLADREHLAPSIARELAAAERWTVEQRWVALGRSPVPADLAEVTARRIETPTPKFTILNRLLAEANLARFAYVLVCDDDVALPAGFLDRYLALVERHDLALAQPARTHGSYVDHALVEQLDGLDARRTRFVEIGPVFSMRADVLPVVTPFSEESPMGWGYDFVWPVLLESAGLRMGIVDATPVAHDLRKPVVNYDHEEAERAMNAFLAGRPHLTRAEAFTILEAYA